MSTTFQQALMALASSLHIVPAGQNPLEFGDPVNLKIEPGLSDLALTSTIENLINVAWLTKSVNFKNSQMLESPMVGDLTQSPPSSGTIEDNLASLLPAVTGIFGQTEGKLPIPIQIPVTLSVTWSAYKCEPVKKPPYPHPKTGAAAASESDGLGDKLIEGVDYVLPNGGTSPDVSFLFGLVSSQPAVCVIVVADVTLNALGATASATIRLKLLVPTLEIPTAVILFRRVDLNKPTSRRRFLLAVPDNVAAPTFELLMEKLRVVRDLARKVRQIRKFIRLVTGINLAISAVSRERSYPHFAMGDEIEEFTSKMNNFPSSMIFFGPPGSWVELYRTPRGWTTPERQQRGQLNVGDTGALIAVIRNLQGDEPHAAPDSGAVRMIYPTGRTEGFGDCLSSLRFHLENNL